MKVVDTSALYATLVVNDPFHRRATDVVASGEPLLVPAEIFSETIALVQYRHGSGAALEAARVLRGKPNIEIQPTPDDFWEDILGAVPKIHAAHPKLSYPDAVVVAWAKARNLAVLAYDEALLEAAA